MAITPHNAVKLSAWLAVHEPGLFRVLLKRTQALQRSPLGRLGHFGDDSFLQDVSLDPGTFVIPADTSAAIDAAALNVDFGDVALADVGVDIPNISQSTTDAINQAIALPDPTTPADATESSGSFWGSISSGAGSVLGAVGKVAGALLSPATITAASAAAAAFFKSQATTAQAQVQTQQAVVQAQLARVAAGGAPAPLSYVRDPVTGAVTPVYYSNTGAKVATPSLLSQLSSPTVAGLSPGMLIGGALVLAVALSLYASR